MTHGAELLDRRGSYIVTVGFPAKQVLWRNLAALMLKRYGRENLNQLARDAKIGPATAARIKEQKTSVGLDVVDKVARVFELQAWQLLLPNLNPDNVPVVMITEDERKLYEKLRRVDAVLRGPDEKVR